MQDEAKRLEQSVSEAADRLEIKKLNSRLKLLKKHSQEPDFWSNNLEAAQVMQEIARLEDRINPWLGLIKTVKDLVDLVALADPKLENELRQSLAKAANDYTDLKADLMFSGKYDNHGAVITISSGAGGTDAQDWTQILFRMYCRYFEKNNWKYSVIDEAQGEEAGIKSVVIEVSNGDLIYGHLKSEHGVHRLVRLSPFNSDHLRQTSFAKVEVLPKIDSPAELEVDEKDLKVDVYRSGGHGGQSVNTTDSAVRITHLPTGISVAIQNERSQLQNKETALTIVRSKLAQLQQEQHTSKLNQLKGPNQSAEWGNQIRSYVMHPYKQVKDLRSGYETSDIEAVLNGEIDALINSYLSANLDQS